MTTTTDNAPTTTGITIGTPPQPLTAAYCAERAAAALAKAEEFAGFAETAAVWLGAAQRWQSLAEAMATNGPMNPRPRDDDNPRRR